ncbi:MAG TPA: M23 family metallopeptidase [Longimicrobiales bacterium]
MSSPETTSRDGGEQRNLTIIIVPHGELDTRSFVISYGKLKFLVVAAVALALAFGVSLAILFPVLAQATRVQSMERELQQLESERARVAELARTLQEVEAQYERVRQMLGADAPVGSESAPVLPPLRGDTATTSRSDDEGLESTAAIDLWPLSVPGIITRTINDARSAHTGLDIAVPANSYIRAAGPGTVRAAGVDDIYGQYVVIDHGGDLESVYGHASKLFVTAGDRVRRSEVIGLTGSTGRSTAPHLHFEIRRGGKVVDPLAFVRQP